MRRLLPVLGLLALGAQGCIIYEDDWERDGDWCSGGTDGSCDPDTSSDTDTDADTTPEPTYALALTPGQAEQGETFVAHLTVEGEFDLSTISGMRFTGGLTIPWVELRQDEVLILVDVPMSADLGAADLVVSRGDLPAILVEAALFIGEPGSGNSSSDCE